MLRALSLLLLAGLGGCNTYPPQGDMSSDFGNSVQANIALQAVNPLPTRLRPGLNADGTRMNSAFVRYETNKVYRLQPVQSMQSPNAAASGGGGGSEPGSSGGAGSGSN